MNISLTHQDDWQIYLSMCSPHVQGFAFDARTAGVIKVVIYLERNYFASFHAEYVDHLLKVTRQLMPMMYTANISALPVIDNALLDMPNVMRLIG